MEPSGRLELTWTNKHLRLVTTEEDGYAWVEPGDPRVSEVRLLHEVETIGEENQDGPPNLLIQGDALHALTALNRIPELAERYAGKVRLIYIDPPFNTGQAFAHYDDNLEHSVWLSMLRDRLVQLKPLLAPNGSIWVHLDDAEVHRCRCVMDEVLGSANFVATVVWQKIHARNNSAQHMSAVHDSMLIYARDKPRLSFARVARTAASDGDFWNPDDDPRGKWRRSDLTASKGYADGRYEVVGPHGDQFAPRDGRWWSVSRATFQALAEDGRLWWGMTGRTFPFRKRFASELGGLVPITIWPHDEVGDNREAKGELTALFGRQNQFATPKPERLLQRVIHLASDPGDLVLDCFAGSGTTAAVAHKMGRRWITAEREPVTLETFTRPRLERVVAAADPGGITECVGWAGGGGFRHVRVGPSMFDLDPRSGDVFLAEWATNGRFSTAVAAQLGFELVEQPPFCGIKGRTRLAVLDGVVGPAEVEFLVASLGDRERTVVVGKAVTEDAEAVLRRLSPGSRLKFAPDDLVRLGGRR